MKVCFILEHFYPHIGGGETMFKEYTSRLVKLGCEVKVATSNSGGVTGKAIYDDVEVQHFPWPGFFGHPIARPRDLYPFVEWADMVHAAILPSAPIALYVANKFNKPCVTTVYEVLGKKWWWVEKNPVKTALFFLFEQFVINRPYTLCHTISQASERDLQTYALRNQKIMTVYPGIKKLIEDYTAEHPQNALNHGSKTFLYYGRPGKTKGVLVLLEAIKKLEGKLPPGFNFRFILANNPPQDKRRAVRMIEQLGSKQRIQLDAPMPDAELIRAIRSSYCVIIPSITEGFGYSTAESCALGMPVIVSDGGSLPEVASGPTLFFTNRDSDDLAQKILLAAEGKFTNIPPRIFTWDDSTRKLLKLYETLLGTKTSLEIENAEAL
jgi:glycosyltransferase involved in cell wall biosynthesis